MIRAPGRGRGGALSTRGLWQTARGEFPRLSCVGTTPVCEGLGSTAAARSGMPAPVRPLSGPCPTRFACPYLFMVLRDAGPCPCLVCPARPAVAAGPSEGRSRRAGAGGAFWRRRSRSFGPGSRKGGLVPRRRKSPSARVGRRAAYGPSCARGCRWRPVRVHLACLVRHATLTSAAGPRVGLAGGGGGGGGRGGAGERQRGERVRGPRELRRQGDGAGGHRVAGWRERGSQDGAARGGACDDRQGNRRAGHR